MGEYSRRFDEALNFTARAHVRQMRKGTDVPYVVHPVHVARLLERYGFDEDVVIAGLLHDVIEDTLTTAREVRQGFGARVAAIVQGCTEEDHEHGWWEDRKEAMIDFLRDAPPDVKAVACADKLHNLSTIRDELRSGGERVWRRFGRGRPDQSWYYREVVDSLGAGWSHPILDELRAVVAEVFGQ